MDDNLLAMLAKISQITLKAKYAFNSQYHSYGLHFEADCLVFLYYTAPSLIAVA